MRGGRGARRGGGRGARRGAARARGGARRSSRPCARSRPTPRSNAPLHEWIERHGLAACRAVLAEAAHRRGLGNRGRGGAARAPARAGVRASSCGAARPTGRRPRRASSAAAAWSAPSAAVEGLAPLASKVHVDRPGHRRRARRLARAASTSVDGAPDAARERAARRARVLVNREGHQFTRHTVSFHAPDAADAGLLARQAEIEELEKRCGELGRAGWTGRRRGSQQAEAAPGRAQRGARSGARLRSPQQQKARHEAQIEQLKLAQALERYRERSAQINAERAEIDARRSSAAAPRSPSARRAAARIGEDIAAARKRLEKARAALYRGRNARSPSSASPCSRPSARRRTRCSASASASPRSRRSTTRCKVIDQQIERGGRRSRQADRGARRRPDPGGAAALDGRGRGTALQSEKRWRRRATRSKPRPPRCARSRKRGCRSNRASRRCASGRASCG